MSNCIEIIEINKLIKNHFVIPSYQRGYRWDKKQVEDLLNDILEFRDKPAKSDDEFYCLQPIVVKKTKNGEYDVIDGQQRLTTIMIILKYLNKMTYSINYVSRKGSKDFLDNICNESQNDISDRNIDFFFMKTAYNVVRDWFETKIDELDEPTLGDELYIVLGKKCKVIWYVVDDYANVENVFTRLNIGKIPLTNAELIKALFLQSKLLSSNEEVIASLPIW